MNDSQDLRTYRDGSWELIATRDGWQVHLHHPKLSSVWIMGEFGDSESAEQETRAEIDRIEGVA